MTIFESDKIKILSKKAFYLYLAVTIILISYVSIILALKGKDGFKTILQKGPISDVPMTLFYAVISWVLFGSILVLLQKKDLNKDNLIVYSAFYINAFLYLNILREKITYGDYWDYINAAFNLSMKEPLNQRYLYPPFWATVLQPFVPLGRDTLIILLKTVNYVSLLLFFILLYRVCRKYGMLKTVSALAVFVITVANTPILRTLGYVQVNIHVMNLILLCLLLSKKHVYISALALSLAIHIKMTPILLVVVFVLNKDWKWLKWFIINMGVIVVFTSLINDINYYFNLSFLKNISTVLNSPGTISYRDCSIDSFVRATFLNLQINLYLTKYIIFILKLGLITLTLFILFKIIKNKIFFQGEKREEAVHNGFILLVVLMTILSPIVWTHHLVFLIFPFLIILKKLAKAEDYILYFSSYFTVFFMPAFNFYPFSYLRLLGVILCYILILRFSRWNKA